MNDNQSSQEKRLQRFNRSFGPTQSYEQIMAAADLS